MSEKKQGCILCDKLSDNNDRANLILWRGTLNYVLMNLYPYNTGHLMVAPYRHIATLEDLDDEEQMEMMRLTGQAMKAIRLAMTPAGFNIGMNIGSVAGAGVDGHVHLHIVPRWGGDTNFMPILSETKVLPETLLATYDRLLRALQGLT